MKASSFLLLFLFPLSGFAQVQFSPEQIISSTATGAISVWSEDLDGDGDFDVVCAATQADKIVWFANMGDGTFSEELVIAETGMTNASDVSTADLDGDGDMDVLATSLSEGKAVWFANDGAGNFSGEISVASNLLGARNAFAADLDGDGDLDVATASYQDDKISWHENDGTGTFINSSTLIDHADWASRAHADDLDGDGDMDVVYAAMKDDEIGWFENLGDGQFSSAQNITTNTDGPRGLDTADLDGDGDKDVMSASIHDNKIAWYQNDGNGDFSGQLILSNTASGGSCVVSADIDDDGDMDVFGASFNDNTIAWFENQGEGVFSSEIFISGSAEFPQDLFLKDLDGDGDLDLLCASYDDNKVAWYANLTGEGCTDPTACNYDPDSWVNNDSCCYGSCGCTDELASNYSADYDCQDNSCMYLLNGVVFDDSNENGNLESTEQLLAFQSATIAPLGLTVVTNDQGEFQALVPSGTYQVSLIPDPNFPYDTTPSSVQVETEDGSFDGLEFGVSQDSPSFDIHVELYPGSGGLCDAWQDYYIQYRNMGSVSVDGIIELEFDGLFSGYDVASPIDSVNDNKIYMSFEDLPPGVMNTRIVGLLVPTVDFIGEPLVSTARVWGYYEGDQLAYGEQTLYEQVTCAYDPNDKQVFPIGYTEDHLVLNDTELEYLVRFQNTGNAPAIDVLLRDTLDANLDLSTFQLMANSHSVITTLNENTREVTFFFENIMLPDSTCCEEDSHGLVSYLIRPLPDLDPGTVIENTAYIYFDNNPPIITNTTWNTIHECDYTIALTAENIVDCPGAATEISTDYNFDIDWESQFSWTLDGVEVGTDSTLILNPYFSTSETFFLTVNNPLCEEYGEDTFSFDLDFNWATCTGDLNCDGDVDAKDMLAFLGDYACNGILCRFDLDGDASVNSEDLMVVLGAFGTECP